MQSKAMFAFAGPPNVPQSEVATPRQRISAQTPYVVVCISCHPTQLRLSRVQRLCLAIRPKTSAPGTSHA